MCKSTQTIFETAPYNQILQSAHIGKIVPLSFEIKKQAENMFQRLVKSLTEQEYVTEKIKAEKPIEWVQKMNNIRNRATEIVINEVFK